MHTHRKASVRMKSDVFDVIVSGGGPTGMMLAAELRLHDVDVVVLERHAQPTPLVRSLGLHARSIEILDQRGLLDRFLEHGTQYPAGVGSFAGIASPHPIVLDSAHSYLLGIPQPVTDRLLSERAAELGAELRRGTEVTGLEQGADGVSVELADGSRLRSRWLVGADGGCSLVRRLLGIAFRGEPAKTEWILGEMQVTAPVDEIAEVSDRVRSVHRGFGIGPTGDGLFRAVVPSASVAVDHEPGLEVHGTLAGLMTSWVLIGRLLDVVGCGTGAFRTSPAHLTAIDARAGLGAACDRRTSAGGVHHELHDRDHCPRAQDGEGDDCEDHNRPVPGLR